MNEGIGIVVYAVDTKGKNVVGWLTGTGAGKYTGLIVTDDGDHDHPKGSIIPVAKNTINLLI